MIKLDVLRTFITVAEAGNLKDAAAQLLRTPPAISMTLSQLENQLGGPLFEGDRKGALTDLGRFVRQVAEVMVRDHDRGVEIIQAYAQNRAGTLRLASVPSVATHLLPALVRDFVSLRPKVDVELIDTDSTDVRRLVETGQADLGLCGAATGHSAIVFRPLFTDHFRLVCSKTHPLARRARPIRWAHLREAELILNEALGVIDAPQFLELARRSRLHMRNLASLLAMVQVGLGVTLLPEMACASLPAGVRTFEFEKNRLGRVVGCATRANAAQSPLAQAFGRHLFAAAPQLLTALGVSGAAASGTGTDRPAPPD